MSYCFAKTFRVQLLDIELDAKADVDFVYSVKDTNGPISSLLDDCRLLVSQIFCWRPSQCFREANRCANVLAKIGASQIDRPQTE